MDCKDYIKQLLNIHPDEIYSYSYLHEIASNYPNEKQYLTRLSAAMSAELDKRDSDRAGRSMTNEDLYRKSQEKLKPGDVTNVFNGDIMLSPESIYRQKITSVAKVSVAQQSLMKFDPATGEDKPYPSHADQYRKFHGEVAWLFNPWTGCKRHPSVIGSDVFGSGIKEPSDG